MASSDLLDIEVTEVDGHGAIPGKAVDRHSLLVMLELLLKQLHQEMSVLLKKLRLLLDPFNLVKLIMLSMGKLF
jgi:hypothetical protein